MLMLLLLLLLSANDVLELTGAPDELEALAMTTAIKQ